jgi:hypothetical protein
VTEENIPNVLIASQAPETVELASLGGEQSCQATDPQIGGSLGRSPYAPKVFSPGGDSIRKSETELKHRQPGAIVSGNSQKFIAFYLDLFQPFANPWVPRATGIEKKVVVIVLVVATLAIADAFSDFPA